MLVKHLYLPPPLKISAKKMNELNFNEHCSIMPKIVYLHSPLCSVHGSPFTKHLPYPHREFTLRSPFVQHSTIIQYDNIIFRPFFEEKNKLFYGSDILQYWGKKMKYPFYPFSFYYRRTNFCQSLKKYGNVRSWFKFYLL